MDNQSWTELKRLAKARSDRDFYKGTAHCMVFQSQTSVEIFRPFPVKNWGGFASTMKHPRIILEPSVDLLVVAQLVLDHLLDPKSQYSREYLKKASRKGTVKKDPP